MRPPPQIRLTLPGAGMIVSAALAPGATLEHTHETYHFTGPREALELVYRLKRLQADRAP